MANEITLSASLSIVKSGVSIAGTVSGLAVTQAGDQSIGNVQNIGTSSEALTIGDVTTIGYLFLKNLDATNYVEFDLNNPVSTTAFCKLLPGEGALIPTRQTTIYGKANTAAVNVHVVAIEL